MKRRINSFNRFLDRFHLVRDLLLAMAATIVACGFTAACHTNAHPDDKQAVYNAMTSHDLASVTVDQDRNKGVIKLAGIVGSPDNKNLAQRLAQEAAPGYSVDNQIRVESTGLMGMAKPNATSPQVEQMAHPPVGDNAATNQKPVHHPKH
jgi:hypothetical protein